MKPIREFLDHDPVSFAIVAYLSRHTQAMDTAAGIAEWWIREELRPTQEALAKLLSLGVVHCLSNGTTRVFAYTRDPRLQWWLRRYVEQQDGRASGVLGRQPPC